MSPVVCALHQTELREGVDEVRHAHGPGATPVLGNVGNDKDPQAGLPGAHEVQRVRGPVSRVGAKTQTSAERHAEQVHNAAGLVHRKFTNTVPDALAVSALPVFG